MLFALAATAAAAQQRIAYTVTGEVNDSTAEGRMIYIERYDDNKYIDSTRIKGGKFVFRGTVVSPCYCYIRATDRDHANFILEGGDVRVSMGEGAYDKPSGTPLNDEMRRISLMETPPKNRFPVETFVREYSDETVREAVDRHEIALSRYQSYLNILEDCDADKYRTH